MGHNTDAARRARAILAQPAAGYSRALLRVSCIRRCGVRWVLPSRHARPGEVLGALVGRLRCRDCGRAAQDVALFNLDGEGVPLRGKGVR